MKTVIFICGLYSLAFAVFHMLFWKVFNWKDDLKKLTFANRAIMQILNLRMTYLLLVMAAICFAFPDELLTSTLGNALLISISLFWLGRTIEQFIFLKVNNRYVHMLTVIFAIGTLLFAIPVLLKN